MTARERRLAVFAPDMAGGGAERAALQLASGLAAEGFCVDLVLSAAEGPFLNEVPSSVNVVDLRARRVLSGLPALIRYLRRAQPDGMASFLNHANVLALWARRIAGFPRRLIVVEQNNPKVAEAHATTFRDRALPGLARRFYPWADAVVGVSAGVVADLAERLGSVPNDRYRVIYNPIVTPDIVELAQTPVDHPWFAHGDPVLVAVGRLRPQKDFPTLLRAFAQVRRRRPAKLVILGDGPERSNLEAIIKELDLTGDVDLPGYVDNPYAYYAKSVAFVLSSRWEGLPTVLIEALSCGAPVIATDCPSGPREILAGGLYGSLLPVGDVDALADALNAALDGKLEAPPDESWKPYTLEAVVGQYVDVLTTAG